jgi:general secretion pathway protein G
MTSCRGFTIVEILIALAVLAALTAIAVPRFQSYRIQAQIAAASADIRNIDLSIQIYKRQNNTLPTSLAALGTPTSVDPWGNAYQYLKIDGDPLALLNARKDLFHVPINSDFDLYSKGTDGQTFSLIGIPGSLDDIIRANDGRYIGLASEY